MTVGIVVIYLGYTFASYGVVLLRGYDITLKQWIDPVHPLTTWPAPNSVPPGQVFPGAESASQGTGTESPGIAQRIERALPGNLRQAFEQLLTGIF